MFYGRSSAFRRRLWERVGGYPEWLYTAEDTLFAMRAKDLGFRAVYAQDAVVHWRPRPTLRKLAKMFYLYGRGQGRINTASPAGIAYWLKYHVAFAFCTIAGIAAPIALLGAASIAFHLARILVLPNYRLLPTEERGARALYYTTIIVVTRNLFSNLGLLRGYLEYRWNPLFRRRLSEYLGSAEAMP
jgi:cellulose synthase/poly-beta-1,6-N-acetylglucosamine synthase-like glycosyltransferase